MVQEISVRDPSDFATYDFVARLGNPLPTDFKDFFRECNGYRPKNEVFTLPGIRSAGDEYADLARLGFMGTLEQILGREIIQPWKIAPLDSYPDAFTGLPEDLFVFGDDYCLGGWALSSEDKVYDIHPERKWEECDDSKVRFGIVDCQVTFLEFFRNLQS